MQRRQFLTAIAGASVVSALRPAIAQEREKLAAIDVNVRTFVTFKVPDPAVQKLLPTGWQVDAPASGQSKGFNLAFYLVDVQLVQDPEGKPLPARPALAFVVPVRKIGSDVATNMVPLGFTAKAGVPGPYSNFGSAELTVNRRSRTDGNGKAVIEEDWKVVGDDGDALEFQIEFERGVPVREKVETRYYSTVRPDFYRIYRVEQGADLVRSTVTGTDRVMKILFKTSGAKLSALFDGTEQLISITSLPFFARSIFLPVS
jgi:hypothetical protein